MSAVLLQIDQRLSRIEKFLSRLDKEQKPVQRKDWLTAAQFKARHSLSSQQIRYLRDSHPDMLKTTATGRYLYDSNYYTSKLIS